MSTDVDQILRDHADEAGRAVPPPDGWTRLEERLADGDGAIIVPIDQPSHGSSRRRRTLWLAAAAALLVVVAAVGVLAATRDDHQSVDMVPATDPSTTEAPTTSEPPSTTPSTTSTTPSTTTTPDTTTTLAEPPPPALPTSLIALVDHDGGGIGDLVVLRADVGVDRVLVEGSPGGDTVEEGGPYGPNAFDVLPDGRVVYEMCCEPAGGDVRIIDPTTGASTYLGYGHNPTVSPDGSRVAVSVYREQEEIHAFDPAAGEEVGGPLLAGGRPVVVEETDRYVQGLAWSPDGARLAIETSRQLPDGEADPMVEVVDLGTGNRQQVPDAVAAAFLADGRLLVSTDAESTDDEWPTLVGTTLAIVDPATGDADPIGDLRVLDLDVTADGRWVLVLGEDGSVRAFSTADGTDHGTVVSLSGLLVIAA